MDGIQSTTTTVAAAGTDREVSLAPMFFGYGLCVHHNEFKKDTALILAKAKAISCLVCSSLLPLTLEIVPGILCSYPYAQL